MKKVHNPSINNKQKSTMPQILIAKPKKTPGSGHQDSCLVKPITASEARGFEAVIGPIIASSENKRLRRFSQKITSWFRKNLVSCEMCQLEKPSVGKSVKWETDYFRTHRFSIFQVSQLIHPPRIIKLKLPDKIRPKGKQGVVLS